MFPDSSSAHYYIDKIGQRKSTIAKNRNQAIDSDFDDFEDAIQYFSATRISADCIISRNLSHYEKSDIAVMTPREFLASHME